MEKNESGFVWRSPGRFRGRRMKGREVKAGMRKGGEKKEKTPNQDPGTTHVLSLVSSQRVIYLFSVLLLWCRTADAPS